MNYVAIERLTVGTPVTYSCALGTGIEATVTSITLARNGAGDLIPWITLESLIAGTTSYRSATIAATESNLIAMEVEVR